MEPVIGEVLTASYKLNIVFISYAISFLGAFFALQSARWMFREDGTLNWHMTICASVALGGIGIWAMHFMGMLAYRVDVPVSYDPILTAVSLVAAIIISGIALFLTGGRDQFKLLGWMFGSVLAGVGACVMHYLGMYAMNLRAIMTLDPTKVGISVAIAVSAAAAALWLAFNVKRVSLQFASSLVMALAVCSMHYVGMSAATMICTSEAPALSWAISQRNLDVWLVVIVAAVSFYLFWVLSSRFVDTLAKTPA
jgi:NO-binding membrane sensor protein with MHYT domain